MACCVLSLVLVFLPLKLLQHCSGAVGLSTTRASWASHRLEDLLVQRSVQTQLYYMASNRDGPKARWLADFLNHRKLDGSAEMVVGEGFGEGETWSYRPLLDGLSCGGDEYLRLLRSAPTETVRVEIAENRKRLSKREQRNPYLTQRRSFFYDEEVDPSALADRVAATARSLAVEWARHFRDLALVDDAQVAAQDRPVPALSAAAAATTKEGAALRYADDDAKGSTDGSPLSEGDRRALERWATLKAADDLLDKHKDLLLEDTSPELVPDFPSLDDDSSLLSERRRVRQQRPQTWLPKGELRETAALDIFLEWTRIWCPRLVKGADDKVRRTHPKPRVGEPFFFPYQGDGLGECDAPEALEALWGCFYSRFDHDIADLPGAYLLQPTVLTVALRKRRAHVAKAAADHLQHNLPKALTSSSSEATT
mmetsp:Transcript_32700/g.104242  ORF Transcript_32700/g.104242 Transcript_32700/m.104242 type:complete len:425 (+) Transcript_32700:68-1342(+)